MYKLSVLLSLCDMTSTCKRQPFKLLNVYLGSSGAYQHHVFPPLDVFHSRFHPPPLSPPTLAARSSSFPNPMASSPPPPVTGHPTPPGRQRYRTFSPSLPPQPPPEVGGDLAADHPRPHPTHSLDSLGPRGERQWHGSRRRRDKRRGGEERDQTAQYLAHNS